jgi:hypothetical protein
MRPKTA